MPQLPLTMTVGVRPGGRHVEQRGQDVGGADAAIGADRDRRLRQAVGNAVDVLGRKAHHRAAGRVEGDGVGVGHAGIDGGLGGGARLFRGRHGLDPGDLGAACLQAADLFAEGVDGVLIGQRAERDQQFAGRADGTGDDDLAAGLVGHRAGDFGGALVELMNAVLRMVQLQPMARAAEGIGQDDVGAGIDEVLVQRGDLFGRRSFQSSGASPASSPMANRFVPVAPSASRMPFSASRASIGLVIGEAFVGR